MFSLLQLCTLFLSVNSLNIPFCINCKHFTPTNVDVKYGKCKMAPKDITDYLVTGNTNDIVLNYCTTARLFDTICGKNGTKYDAIDT